MIVRYAIAVIGAALFLGAAFGNWIPMDRADVIAFHCQGRQTHPMCLAD